MVVQSCSFISFVTPRQERLQRLWNLFHSNHSTDCVVDVTMKQNVKCWPHWRTAPLEGNDLVLFVNKATICCQESLTQTGFYLETTCWQRDTGVGGSLVLETTTLSLIPRTLWTLCTFRWCNNLQFPCAVEPQNGSNILPNLHWFTRSSFNGIHRTHFKQTMEGIRNGTHTNEVDIQCAMFILHGLFGGECPSQQLQSGTRTITCLGGHRYLMSSIFFMCLMFHLFIFQGLQQTIFICAQSMHRHAPFLYFNQVMASLCFCCEGCHSVFTFPSFLTYQSLFIYQITHPPKYK